MHKTEKFRAFKREADKNIKAAIKYLRTMGQYRRKSLISPLANSKKYH